MICFSFKGGIGTLVAGVAAGGKSYTVGVLVQCNTGDRKVLRIAGAPVGQAIRETAGCPASIPSNRKPEQLPKCGSGGTALPDQGSIIIVVGTDAPLMPLQLNRVAKRAALGLARLGSYSGNESGDFIVGFSTVARRGQRAEQDKPSPIAPLAECRGRMRFSKRRCRRPRKRSSTRWSRRGR